MTATDPRTQALDMPPRVLARCQTPAAIERFITGSTACVRGEMLDILIAELRGHLATRPETAQPAPQTEKTDSHKGRDSARAITHARDSAAKGEA